VSVPAADCVVLPATVDAVEAAAMPMVYGTSFHALVDRGRLQAGETLLVLGASGGVGLAAVQIGKALGATVIAAAGSAEKCAVARQQGADHLIDYTSEDMRARLKTITGGDGIDVVFDPVGGRFSEPAFRSLGWDGRHLVVGFAGGTIPALPLNLALLKASSLVGVFVSEFMRRKPERAADNFSTLLGWLEAGRIKPLVSQIFPLAEGASAIAALAERRAVGKLVVKVR
jgi:NADPH2:quinone reductase